ncbi:MAG: tryptophan-rich sensory protein [Pyrinomonadaceae bacterium]|nr:tryptophan-rich sensory protein [Sphingobacteriaceae bacterium]
MKLKNLIALIICVAIPLITGGIAGIVTSSNIKTWYAYLIKPEFNPPNWLFGPVWTILYILMGISLFIIWKQPANKQRNTAIKVFFVQLILNFAWSFIFFNYHQTGIALIEIFVLWLAILMMIVSFYRLNRWSAYIQFPYLAWVTFASVLNASIWYLNK